MVNLTWRRGTPDLAAIAAEYGVPQDALDPTFGVIAVSPSEHVYTVRVTADWASKIAKAATVGGPFPEGRVEPFGNPR